MGQRLSEQLHRDSSQMLVVQWEADDAFAPAVPRQLLESVLTEVLSGRGLPGPVAVGLTVTGDDQMRELNRRYRGIDAPTDVLSFPQLEFDRPERPRWNFPLPPGEPLLLGDIVLSFNRAAEQAASYGHSLERELAFLVVHGALHLLGYDHEDPVGAEQMRREEEAVLARMGLGR